MHLKNDLINNPHYSFLFGLLDKLYLSDKLYFHLHLHNYYLFCYIQNNILL